MTEDQELDAPLVAAIIRRRFPEVRARSVVWLGEGYDSTAFEVDGEWVFRFPKRSDVEQQLLLEMRLVPTLAADSPLPLPEFTFRGSPAEDFPHHFVGYRMIPGVPAIRIRPEAIVLEELGPVLARFLSWLHAFSRERSIRLGVPQQHIALVMDEARAEALEDFVHVARVAPDQPLQEWLRFLTDAPGIRTASNLRPALVHGDFAAEHVLYEAATSSVTGVIDWSEVAVGDPSLDLAGLIHWGGARLLDAVLATYRGPVHTATVQRARYLAACRGVADVAFGLETGREEYTNAGVRALALSIPLSADSS